MQIDLTNPITILFYLVFVFGGAILIEWFKQQIELSAKYPQKASKSVERLSLAGRKLLFLTASLLIILACGFIIFVGGREYLYNDKLFGLTFIIVGIASMLNTFGYIRGDNLFNDMGLVGFFISSITFGIWWSRNSGGMFGYMLIAAASINLLQKVYKIFRTNYDNEKPISSKRTIYLLASFLLLFLTTKIIATNFTSQITDDLLALITTIIWIFSIVTLAMFYKGKGLQYRFISKIITATIGLIALYGVIKREPDSILAHIGFIFSFMLLLSWSHKLMDHYFPDQDTKNSRQRGEQQVLIKSTKRKKQSMKKM